MVSTTWENFLYPCVCLYKNHHRFGLCTSYLIFFNVFSSDFRVYLSLWKFQGGSHSTINPDLLLSQHFLPHLLSLYSVRTLWSQEPAPSPPCFCLFLPRLLRPMHLEIYWAFCWEDLKVKIVAVYCLFFVWELIYMIGKLFSFLHKIYSFL